MASLAASPDTTGRRRRRTVYGRTRAEVARKLEELKAERLAGVLAYSEALTVAGFLTRWLEDSCRASVRPTTFECYERVVRLRVAPYLGPLRLDALRPAHIQGLYAELGRRGDSPRMRQLVHAVLHRAFVQAERWELIARNPCDAVDRPRVPRREVPILNPDEVQQLLEAARGGRLEALYTLAVATGARQGELLGLRWQDVDLERGLIRIQRTLVEVGGHLELSEPKSARSRRRIDLPDFAVEALGRHRAQLPTLPTSSDLVFTDTKGGPLRKQNLLRRSWRPLLEQAGLPRIHFHALRHTHASMLLAADVHPKIVQERLGHSSIMVTMDIYSHVLVGLQREAARALDAVLAKPVARGHPLSPAPEGREAIPARSPPIARAGVQFDRHERSVTPYRPERVGFGFDLP